MWTYIFYYFFAVKWVWNICKKFVQASKLLPIFWIVSHLTAFCAWHSSPHLQVTPVQLMRPGIGWNTSCAEGDFTQHLLLGLIFTGRCRLLICSVQSCWYWVNLEPRPSPSTLQGYETDLRTHKLLVKVERLCRRGSLEEHSTDCGYQSYREEGDSRGITHNYSTTKISDFSNKPFCLQLSHNWHSTYFLFLSTPPLGSFQLGKQWEGMQLRNLTIKLTIFPCKKT